MTTRTVGGTPYTYTYGETSHVDAPTQYNGGGQSNGYGYDADGNQVGGIVKGVHQVRTFDAENRLLTVMTGTTTLSFIYDGNSQRVIQSVTQGGATTRTLYVGGVYEETITPNSSTPPYISYYSFGGKLVGMRRANQANSSSNGQQRVVGDQLGSTTLIIDAGFPSQVVQRTYYKPYGEVAQNYTSASSTSYTSKGFTGQRLDGDSGLMYYGARFYDPALAYFISPDAIVPGDAVSTGGGGGTLGSEQNSKLTVDFHETGFLSSIAGEHMQIVEKGFWFQLSNRDRQQANDPFGPRNPQALNRYSYVLSNPLRYIDPTGHREIVLRGATAIGQFITTLKNKLDSEINVIIGLYTAAAIGTSAIPIVGVFGGIGLGLLGLARVEAAKTEEARILDILSQAAKLAGDDGSIKIYYDDHGGLQIIAYDGKGIAKDVWNLAQKDFNIILADPLYRIMLEAATETQRILPSDQARNICVREQIGPPRCN